VIVVTGGAGFIGSNLARALNARGIDDIVIVDDLSNAAKIRNLDGCRFADYLDKEEFLAQVRERRLPRPAALFHQGACSNTMEPDGRFMMETNYAYSKALLHYCLEARVPFIYASSASVYGAGRIFAEHPANESALNVYAFSKLRFDHYVRRHLVEAVSQVVGLRYFNVYGPGEAHKGGMASVAYHFHNQYRDNGQLRLFEGSGGYENGAQERDFVWVGDVAEVNLHFLDHPDVSGIFNVGTGASRGFNDMALAVVNAHEPAPLTLPDALADGRIAYIPFPEGLRDKYQSYTRADISALRNAGYEAGFKTIEQGVNEYIKQLTDE